MQYKQAWKIEAKTWKMIEWYGNHIIIFYFYQIHATRNEIRVKKMNNGLFNKWPFFGYLLLFWCYINSSLFLWFSLSLIRMCYGFVFIFVWRNRSFFSGVFISHNTINTIECRVHCAHWNQFIRLLVLLSNSLKLLKNKSSRRFFRSASLRQLMMLHLFSKPFYLYVKWRLGNRKKNEASCAKFPWLLLIIGKYSQSKSVQRVSSQCAIPASHYSCLRCCFQLENKKKENEITSKCNVETNRSFVHVKKKSSMCSFVL